MEKDSLSALGQKWAYPERNELEREHLRRSHKG